MTYPDLDPKRLKTEAKEVAVELLGKIDDPSDRIDALVYKDKPRTKSQEFEGYPYIHIDGVNIINSNSTADGSMVTFTVDIECHVWGTEDTETEVENFDEVVDQLTYLLTGPEKVTLSQEASMTEPNIIRNVDFTGIREKDQPVLRQELEFRTEIQKNMYV